MAEQMKQNKAGEMTAKQAIPVGYKQTEVGVIPEDWDVKRISDIADVFSGGTPNRENPKFWDGNVPWITTTLIDGKDIIEANEFITEAGVVGSSVKWCRPGAILMAMYGQGKTRGKVAILSFNATINQACAAIELKDLTSSVFVLHMLTHMYKIIRELSNAGGQENLSGFIIKNIRVPYPPKQERIAIANSLSDTDALISGLEQLIAKKQAIKTATMQQLLTGRTRLPQFALRPDGTPKGYKPSELGEIPEDWAVCEMGALGFTYGGLTGKSKKDFGHGNGLYVPFTNVMANIIVDIAKLEKVHVAENQNDVINGDLLFNGSSETPEEVCFCSLVNHDVSGLYLNSFCFGFRRKDGAQYIPIYLSYWFRSSIGRKAVSIMAQGSTRYNISKKQFLQLSITLPSIEEQTAIATILSDMDNELQALTQKLEKARALKQGMMQQLLTGRIRLPLPQEA